MYTEKEKYFIFSVLLSILHVSNRGALSDVDQWLSKVGFTFLD